MTTWALSWFQLNLFIVFFPSNLISCWFNCLIRSQNRCPTCVYSVIHHKSGTAARAEWKPFQKEQWAHNSGHNSCTRPTLTQTPRIWADFSVEKQPKKTDTQQHTQSSCLTHKGSLAPETLRLQVGCSGGGGVYSLRTPMPSPCSSTKRCCRHSQRRGLWCGMCVLTLYFNVSNNLVVN